MTGTASATTGGALSPPPHSPHTSPLSASASVSGSMAMSFSSSFGTAVPPGGVIRSGSEGGRMDGCDADTCYGSFDDEAAFQQHPALSSSQSEIIGRSNSSQGMVFVPDRAVRATSVQSWGRQMSGE